MSLAQRKPSNYSATELKAVERSVLRKRRALWGGFLVALIPLVVLLGLQSWWLADLENSSAVARKATLRNFLDAVVKEVHVYYLKISERALNLPPEALAPEKIRKIGYHFKKKNVYGARQLFVVSYLDRGSIYFYNPKTHEMEVPDFSHETLAVWAAIAPWKVLLKKGVKIDTGLSVDQRDPANRIILNPITDENWMLVGLVGMIVDQDFFESELLPKATTMALHEFSASKDLQVVVRDQHKHQVFPCADLADTEHEVTGDHEAKWTTHEKALAAPAKDVVRDNFTFIFTDWTIALQGSYASPESWARTNFAYNMTLSAVLAIVLISGILLALRTAAREMHLSTMKNDFVSNVSHELRTPLSSIRVFGEFMRLGRVQDQAKVREYGEYIETESRRLTQLINNILDFSRIESGQVVYRFEATDLDEVVAESLATFSVRLKNSGFEVLFEHSEDEIPTLRIDGNAIGRALNNLVDNAVKYSDGERKIVVGLHNEGDSAVISVTDHGIGIPAGEQERIFERFHRVSTGLVHDVKGSGLGLALVQHIVAAHDGRVTVVSEPGKGSTFSIHLPLHSPRRRPTEDKA